MRLHCLRQLVEDKSVANCQQTCCKLIVKTCYHPQACCKLFQQVVTSLQITCCNKPDFSTLDGIEKLVATCWPTHCFSFCFSNFRLFKTSETKITIDPGNILKFLNKPQGS